MRTPPRPEGHHMALAIFLLWDSRRGCFLMSEVPLYLQNNTLEPQSGPALGAPIL